jgi:arylformamidase
LLLKTRNSEAQRRGVAFREDYVHLEPDAARFLAGKGLVLVGIDALSVDRFGADGYPAHKALLEAGICVVEGLDLSQVTAGDYDLFCGPLRITDADGAPARVFLLDPVEESVR